MDLYELIQRARKKDADSCYEIIVKFEGLIKKYARKLAYEDAQSDLICFLVELLYSFPLERLKNKDDGYIVSYLARCIKNQYILLLKREIEKKREIYFTEMSEAQEFRVKTQMAVEDCYEGLIFIEIKAILNKKEWFIIEQIFIKGRTAAEIGNLMGVTRQAVNQIKIRSLKKIKRVLSPEK